MDAHDRIPLKTPEVIPFMAMVTSHSLIIGSAVFAVLLLAVWLFLNRTTSPKRGNHLLLVGPPDAGKTAILSQLAFNQMLPTQTSMQINVSNVSLSPKKTFRVIDVPGHPRLRGQFVEHLSNAKAIAFVVDASTISRNAPAVAEHLHHILHVLTSLPPSQHPPALLILAHKYDLLRTTSTNRNPRALAVDRVQTILERELEKRRESQSGGVGVEGLGEEGEKTDMGGLDCGEKEGSAFKFDEWEGGDIPFLGTSVSPEKSLENNLDLLSDWLIDNM